MGDKTSVMDHAVDMAQEIIRLRELNAELVAALETVAALSTSDGITTGRPLAIAIDKARAALAKVN